MGFPLNVILPGPVASRLVNSIRSRVLVVRYRYNGVKGVHSQCLGKALGRREDWLARDYRKPVSAQ